MNVITLLMTLERRYDYPYAKLIIFEPPYNPPLLTTQQQQQQ